MNVPAIARHYPPPPRGKYNRVSTCPRDAEPDHPRRTNTRKAMNTGTWRHHWPSQENPDHPRHDPTGPTSAGRSATVPAHDTPPAPPDRGRHSPSPITGLDGGCLGGGARMPSCGPHAGTGAMNRARVDWEERRRGRAGRGTARVVWVFTLAGFWSALSVVGPWERTARPDTARDGGKRGKTGRSHARVTGAFPIVPRDAPVLRRGGVTAIVGGDE